MMSGVPDSNCTTELKAHLHEVNADDHELFDTAGTSECLLKVR